MKHFLFYGLSSAMQSFVGFLLLPLFTRHVSAEDFGAYSLMVFYTSLISSIFYFGTTASLNRFYFIDEGDDKSKSHVVSSNLFITVFGAILQVLLTLSFIELGSHFIFSNVNYLYDLKIMVVASSIGLISNYFLAVLRVLNESRIYFLVNIIASLTNLIITSVLLTTFGYGILAPILGLLSSNTFVGIFIIFFVHRKITFSINFEVIKSCFRFGSSIIILGFCFSLLDWIDRIILERFTTLTEVGIYSFGYRIGIIVYVLFSVPFAMAWSTTRMEKLKLPNYDSFTSKAVVIYSVIGWFLVLVFSVFVFEILFLVGGKKEYFESISIIPIILSSYLIYGYVSILDFGIFMSRKMYYYIISFLVSIIFNFTLNILFIPYFGKLAAAYNTLGTYILYISLIYFFSKKFFSLKLEWKTLLKIIFPVFFILAFNAFLIQYFSNISFWLIGVKLCILAGYGYFLWKYVLSFNEKEYIAEWYKKKARIKYEV